MKIGVPSVVSQKTEKIGVVRQNFVVLPLTHFSLPHVLTFSIPWHFLGCTTTGNGVLIVNMAATGIIT